jgi:hypothetical protein
MGNMFYNVLGGVATQSITATHNTNYDLFTGIQSFDHWSGTEFAPDTTRAWDFVFDFGWQDQFIGKFGELNAWAVYDGDIGAVPTPPAIWLFGSGLLGLIGLSKR